MDYFYEELVLKDETVQHFFVNTDIEKQKQHQTKFISFALGGPKNYTGMSMAKANEGMNIQPEHFNAIAAHPYDALAHYGVDESDIGQALEKAAALKDVIIYK